MTDKEIRETIKHKFISPRYTDNLLADNFPCAYLGRFFSAWFIRHDVTPNFVTMLMIAFGIIGSILFALPCIACKIAGYLCWIMWYTMDNSDGQVARYTKKFSRYGSHMDFMAHLIDHPFMTIAIWLTFLQIDYSAIFTVSIFTLIVISCEMLLRNITSFQFQIKKDDNKSETATNQPGFVKYMFIQFTLFPNIIVLFSWIIILDYWLKSGFSLYIFYGWAVYFTACAARMAWHMLMKFYKS